MMQNLNLVQDMLQNRNLFHHMLHNLNLVHGMLQNHVEIMQNLNLFLTFFETFQHTPTHLCYKSTIANFFATLTTTATSLRH